MTMTFAFDDDDDIYDDDDFSYDDDDDVYDDDADDADYMTMTTTMKHDASLLIEFECSFDFYFVLRPGVSAHDLLGPVEWA